jgi:2-succinyl-5-enolpyruvyl-6-hydroxy-3-cyclohexene-1-carboxylate synthase
VVAGDDAGPPARQLAERAAGRCSPSRPAGRAPAPMPCAPTAFSSTRTSARDRAGSSSSGTRRCRAGLRLLARDDVEVWRGGLPGWGTWARRPFTVDTTSTTSPCRRTRTRRGSTGGAGGATCARRPRPRRVARRPTGPYGVRRGRRGGASAPREGLLVVGASNRSATVDLMVPPLPGRRPPEGDRQPRVSPAIDWRRLDGGRCRPRPSLHPQSRPGRRRDVPPLQQRTRPGPGRASPDLTIVVTNDDGGSIFATLEQGAEEYATATTASSAPRTAVDISPASLCRDAHPAPEGHRPGGSSSTALATPNGGIEVDEAVVRRDDPARPRCRIRALAGDD